jgi:enediyne biosynthesis protein E4
MQNGIAQATRMTSGWGLKFFDYDNDGNLDLFLVNGNPDDLIESLHPGVTYREPALLFHNNGGRLQDVSAESGPFFRRPVSARGLAIGDFDNDGAIDVLISLNDERPVLLRNKAGTQNHWLGLKLVGRKSNPDAVGARITYQSGDLKRTLTKVGGGSYLSSHDPRVVLGLGNRARLDSIEIQWPRPSGLVQRLFGLPIDRYIKVIEGEQTWSECPVSTRIVS